MTNKIEISHRTIVFTILFLIFSWVVFLVRDILLQIFVAFVLMSVLNPTITKLEKKYRVPRIASILVVYVLIITIVSLVIAVLVPPLVEQTSVFTTSLPKYFSELNLPFYIIDEVTRQITSGLSQLPSQFIKIGFSVFSNVFSVLTVFVFALYFLLARNNLDNQLNVFLKEERITKIENMLKMLEKDLGGWARGQITLMAMVGVSTYVGLLILGVPFALPLSLLAGVFEAIPNIGPIVASIPVILVGFGVSPLTGLACAALAFLIQQIENYIFVPKVMENSANVSPVITLATLLIGFRLAGIPGAILSIPIVITARVVLREYVFNK